ncbi:guanosine-5'-triphosphate,3'-diphosphate diphosphatase [Psychrosphaera sp. B3R10]|uniref:guanosine-5'-triphosphate,3'-diphosphate diphosphatase n=1 Tax=unclassified Psychrosphaera TaxID=2641570 RepID=UPI001C0A402C|nr:MULTISPECIES: guanosine-5'-triphosphate,3'-diphosphate diphosphatase [unclassified Psychrosphaera]MBU2880589.1 guanosine-5'-triphosphate,3'-diphosphate diphosphatase [Psychrosphaera sp. I2R16]MBU2990675.1 guanosine-5'-triphosphate,3'-diphosphate diphosphatase [Psychrosphaera sp. B3R10]MDO6720796.1 guanosine-5'-triphosphate,3'-diphosphate diphosphatase [Psychrosphaera sp. 1_MG-2023]
MEKNSSYAVIDLGSNSFHMMIAQVVAGSVQIIGRVKRKVRLASGLDENLILSDEAMLRGWECLDLFAERLQDIPINNIRIAGTATLRLATNVSVFLDKAEQILGLPIEIISGEREAQIIYKGVAYTSSRKIRRLVIDIGGASTELIAGDGDTPVICKSLNVGCVTYLERYFPGGYLSETNYTNAIAAAELEISTIRDLYKDFNWNEEVGASGTVQAIQEILIHQGHDEIITLERLVAIMQQSITYGIIDNLTIPGLVKDRRMVFPSGVSILIAIFRQLNLTGMTLAGGALREGQLYSMLPELTKMNVRNRTIESVMTRYHVDKEHAKRVAELSINLAKQTEPSWDLQQFEALDILRAAAMVHEVGLQVAYKGQQLHSSYILANTNLPGFTEAQKKLLTSLVLNHREDIDKDSLYKQSSTSVLLACRLARILRLAVILALRRADEVLPAVEIVVTNEDIALKLPKNWLDNNPLSKAELNQEAGSQAELGWKLFLD